MTGVVLQQVKIFGKGVFVILFSKNVGHPLLGFF